MKVNNHNVYRLSNIVRYCQLSKIKNETVAEHSFFVMWFINWICTQHEIGDKIRLMALEAGLYHDVPEAITNDITYDVKKLIPDIPRILQPYEEDIIGEHSKVAVKVLYNPETYEEILANKIVNHADNLSVLQYCENVETLGNKEFITLKLDSCERVKKSFEEFKTALEGGK